MAWLQAAPRRSTKEEKEAKPRLAYLDDDNPAKCLPDIDDFYSTCFKSLGSCLAGGMGASPITWVEVNAFANRSGYALSGWDCEQLIMMSRSYCNYLDEARDPLCPAPYQNIDIKQYQDDLQKRRDKVASQWDAFTSGLKPKK